MTTNKMMNAWRRLPLWLAVPLVILLRLALAGLPLFVQARVDGAPVSGRAVALLPMFLILISLVEVLVFRRLQVEEEKDGDDDGEGGSLCPDCQERDP